MHSHLPEGCFSLFTICMYLGCRLWAGKLLASRKHGNRETEVQLGLAVGPSFTLFPRSTCCLYLPLINEWKGSKVSSLCLKDADFPLQRAQAEKIATDEHLINTTLKYTRET